MDKETKEILSDADHIRSLLDSDGWKIIKAKLDSRILDLQNIHNLDMSDISTLAAQLASRKMAVDIIWSWLKQDVVGFVEQQESNAAKVIEKGIENFIERQ